MHIQYTSSYVKSPVLNFSYLIIRLFQLISKTKYKKHIVNEEIEEDIKKDVTKNLESNRDGKMSLEAEADQVINLELNSFDSKKKLNILHI